MQQNAFGLAKKGRDVHIFMVYFPIACTSRPFLAKTPPHFNVRMHIPAFFGHETADLLTRRKLL
jgi:hypothetical protein